MFQGQLQWSTSSGKKNDCHQHAKLASDVFKPGKYNQVLRQNHKASSALLPLLELLITITLLVAGTGTGVFSPS